MTNAHWISGTRVKINSTGLSMTVVGYDSVGSVICEWNRGGHAVRGYVNPMILALASGAELNKGIS